MKALVLVFALGLSACASPPMVALRQNLGLAPLYDPPRVNATPVSAQPIPAPEAVTTTQDRADLAYANHIVGMGSVPKLTFTPKPPPKQLTAKGIDLVNGAIVCPSLDEAQWLYGQINVARHMRQSLPPELIQQAALIRGYDESREPYPPDYGCQLVPDGTPMNVKMNMGVIPVVWGTMSDGRPFAGVTLPNMIDH